MTTATQSPVRRLSAAEFASRPSDGVQMELVRGVEIPMNMPSPRHGEICLQTGHLLKLFLATNPIGRAVSNDSGIITQHDPDTVRGADVAFYSHARLPATIPLPMRGYAGVVPDLVFEVRSYTDSWPMIHTKVAEYLAAGVTAVAVLDEQTQRAWVYSADNEPREFGHDDPLRFPPPLEGWQVTASQFFG
jgi:Uma2 family endonuclease